MLKLEEEGRPGVWGRGFTSLLVQHHHRVDASLFTLETRSQAGRERQSPGRAFQNKSPGLFEQLVDLIRNVSEKTASFVQMSVV